MAARRGVGSRGGSYEPEETRRLLLAASLALFEELGYHATTVESIVTRAGVTKGAFYHHFEGKEDVLFQIQDDYIEDRLRNCRLIMAESDDPREQLKALIREALIGIETHRSAVVIFMQERRFLVGERFAPIKKKRDKVNATYEDVLRAGIKLGYFAPDINPRIIAFGILGMCAWAFTWYRPGGRLRIEQIADYLTVMVTSGIELR